jgi:hypothetical protein
MSDETALRDQLAALTNEVRQMHALVQDLRTVLLGASGAAPAHDPALDAKRIIGDGARAYVTGLSTSPHREGSQEEGWWRFGWQLAKDAVKGARGDW